MSPRSAVDYLQANAAQAGNWFVTLPQPRNPAMQMFWRLPPELADPSRGRRGGFGEATLDPNTGQALKARETRGGDFFYRLHFDLHYIPVLWARYLVGFCAMFMLVAIITGVITHKKIFKDFFTFRKDKGLRSWLDFHNVSAVMALPYHAMITYTGIVTLMVMYLPWGESRLPAGRRQVLQRSLRWHAGGDRAGRRTRHAAADRAVAGQRTCALARRGSGRLHRVQPGAANAVIDIRQRDGKRLSTDTPAVRYNMVNGTLLEETPPSGGATATRGVLYGLHLARFADWGLRALFFLSGLVGCLMVASGVVLWAVKERPKHAKWAHRLRPAPGRCAEHRHRGRPADRFRGLLLGQPPAAAGHRRARECGGQRVLLRLGRRAAGRLHLAEADDVGVAAVPGAAAFALVPVVNALTTHAHLGITLRSGDWVLAGVDLSMIAFGAMLALCGWRMQRGRHR